MMPITTPRASHHEPLAAAGARKPAPRFTDGVAAPAGNAAPKTAQPSTPTVNLPFDGRC